MAKSKKDKNVPLLYKIPDAEMQEAARTCRESFNDDIADFVAWDADFDAPFAADWLTLIITAEGFVTDEVLDDQLKDLTADTETALKNCRVKFQDSKFFIEKTFPSNKQKWHEFGYDDYNIAQRSQVRMIQFMKNFHVAADKYKTNLIANGYAQPKIDEINTLRTALLDTNQLQENFIKNLPNLTRARRLANNDVWKVFQKVCKAGKRIYKDNYAKYQRYLLPPGEEPVPPSIKILAKDGNGDPLKDVLAEVLTTSISVHTNIHGRLQIGGLPDGNYTLTISKAGFASQTINATVVAGTPVELVVVMVP